MYNTNSVQVSQHGLLLVMLSSRSFYDLHLKLQTAPDLTDVVDLTGCRKPCNYKEYVRVDDLVELSVLEKDVCRVGVWLVSPNTLHKTEVPIYPWESYVAEFGG